MIIFHTVSFLIISFLTLISLAGLGQILIHDYRKNVLESIFFGFIIVAIIVTFIHFFFKIDFYFLYLILLIGIMISLKQKLLIFKKINKEKIIYLLIFFCLVPLYISQKYHEDFGYYHLPYLINLFNEKIIFGLANTNIAFIYNSIWLNISSIFLTKNSYDYVNLPTFLAYVIFIIFFIKENIKTKEKKISNYFAIVGIFYFILKFTRISEFGNDLPSILFSLLSIFYFLRFFETNELNDKKYYFFSNLSFSVFAILIKFSSIPIFILTIFLFMNNFKILKKEIFKFNYFCIYFLCTIFFIQQFIYSGCLIYPSKFTCLNVVWFDEEFLFWSNKLEIINKSYSDARNFFSETDYLKNFNWFPYWFKRNSVEILEHLTTMLFPLIFLSIFSKNNITTLNFNTKKLFIFFVLSGFIFWLTFSPVYRFAVVYFLSLIFLCTLILFKKSFSKKVFINLIILFLFFNFSKNLKRIFNKDDIFFGIEKIQNNSILYSYDQNNLIKVYRPNIENNANNGWQGRLCWDIKFLCSYDKVKINKKYGYLFINKLND